ncbi:lamin tail domain-containing protein [Geobacter pelophilus]|uniref:Lamin tail domain-containing protein n=1 Tax=Geoanaerobacter pelophilus TaxID=60036 RepID=A0AAW4LA85_9BACT|nr:lamin tail domain-containing protein [Geoanaerobacter pelophilus]MBT0665993.1 lamin tail domain-containing protein [Geoanaerobacter pelophilus]
MPGRYRTPGVYIRELTVAPARELATGIPLFIGYAADGAAREPLAVGRWDEFRTVFGDPAPDRYLAYSVRGFFANGGSLCHVCAIDRGIAVSQALEALFDELSKGELLAAVDLICVPEIQLFPSQALALQQKVLDFCRARASQAGGYLFAILDSVKGVDTVGVLQQRQALTGDDGALYYPWIRVSDGPVASGGCVPPCGHIAGIYARSDQMYGVHKAPANEIVEEAIDLETVLNDQGQGELNPENVSCLRSFPGRGIRVWGARTVSRDPAWTYVNVRRLFLAICRTIEQKMAELVFEPNDPTLWMRIRRELGSYLGSLHRKGAFQGEKPEEAYFVKCDSETNSSELRDQGKLVVVIGLAMAAPAEFIIVRIVQTDGGVTVTPDTGLLPSMSMPSAGNGAEVEIVSIYPDPPGADLAGEFVTLRNRGGSAVELTGWVLRDLAGHRYVFPNYTIHPGAEVKVWTKPGEDTLNDLYWGHRAPLWNNTGDTAYLLDEQERLAACFAYEGVRNKNKTRQP